MSDWVIDPNFLLSFSGLLLAILSFIYTFAKDKTSDVRVLENRLTTLEGNQFTDEDRKTLKELEVKMGVFWNIIVREAPKLLKQKITPYLDVLLSKAELGLSELTPSEKKELLSLLDERYAVLTKGDVEDSGKALVLALYKGILEIEVSNQES